MIGLNVGLQIARKALSAYQLAINVHGNNISNVNSEGYSRQRTELKEGGSTRLGFGYVGLGVDVRTISRMRDRFLDDAFRNETATLGKFDSMERTLSEIEMILKEPSDIGLGAVLGKFWDAWQDLANQPESQTSRLLVTDSAESLCYALRELDSRLNTMRGNLDAEIRAKVEEINSIASKIATLNGNIVTGEVSGHEANNLRDERDGLLDQLAGIVTIKVFDRGDGSVSVMIGTEALIERTDTVQLTLSSGTQGGIAITDVNLADSGRPIRPPEGELAGLLESRDSLIPDYIARLDTLAQAIVENVNQTHRMGYGLDGSSGHDFFDPAGITAGTMSVSEAILDNAGLIAASSDGSPGNADNALAVAALRFQGIIGREGSSPDAYYSFLIGSLGIESADAASHKEGQDLLVREITNRRESVKGVSLDEETTDLMAAQHAYEAAARLVAVIDEMMVSLMSMVGR